jgi:hypothetical protein
MDDKLSILNAALALTGNNEVHEEEDGSEEWRVPSAAYEEGLKYLLGQHDWKFGTQIYTLSRVGDSDDENFTDAYAKPVNALGLAWVRIDGYPADYRVVGNRILVDAASGVKAMVVLRPDPGEMPPLFLTALNCLVKAGCYEGLNEDPTEARNLRKEAEGYLQLAKTRGTSEGSVRPAFQSRMLARRRGRLLTRLP